MANYIIFVNEAEHRVAKVKVGFSWVCLFWTWLFALPLFIRRIYPWAFGIAALELLFYFIERKFVFFGFDYSILKCLAGASDFCPVSWSIYHLNHQWSGLITFGISVYLGFFGNEITARYYLKNGYHFADPDSTMVKLAKVKWRIQL